MRMIFSIAVLCAIWYVPRYYSWKKKYDIASWLWGEDDRQLYVAISQAAYKCGIAEAYKIKEDEWYLVGVILDGFRNYLATLFFSDKLVLPSEDKRLRKEKERENQLFGNTLQSRIFLYLLREYLSEHEHDFTFLKRDMVGAGDGFGSYPMTDFSVVFHKVLNIVHHFCCTEAAFGPSFREPDYVEADLRRGRKYL